MLTLTHSRDLDADRVQVDGLHLGWVRPCGPSWNRHWIAATPDSGFLTADVFPTHREAVNHLLTRIGVPR